jgi:RNA methyltransferase, TrmH family
MLISSRSNPSIKQIRSLQKRKEREQTGLFFIEGIRIVVEAIQQQAHIDKLIVAPDLLESSFAQEIVQEQERAGLPCLRVTADVFKSISLKEGPQGIGAVVYQKWESLSQRQPAQELCWLALDRVQDPGNLGTILRTSDAVGAAGVILIDHTTDPYDPASIRASMGAIFSQTLIRASIDDLVAWKNEHHATLVGTSDAASHDFRAARYPFPLILFMGSEAHGLPHEYQKQCDLMVKIPMVGSSDSLNLAVATGIVLYEIFYQATPGAINY